MRGRASQTNPHQERAERRAGVRVGTRARPLRDTWQRSSTRQERIFRTLSNAVYVCRRSTRLGVACAVGRGVGLPPRSALDPPFGAAVRTNSVRVRGVVLLAVVVVALATRAARQHWRSPGCAGAPCSARRSWPRPRTPGQSCQVSMNTGICRVVLAWASSSWRYCAANFGHSSARAVSSSSSASTANVWVPTSAFILGLALRL